MRPPLLLILLLTVAPIARAAELAPARADFTLPTTAFVVDGGTQVKLSASTRLVLDCSLVNDATFAPAPGSAVVLTGYGLPMLEGVTNFANLTLAIHTGAGLANAASVNGLLTLTSGRLSLSGHDLTVNSVSGGSAASYVATPDTAGRLVRRVGSSPLAFPVGNSSYDPVVLRTAGPSDDVRVAVMDAPAPGRLTPAVALTRAWAINGRNPPGTDGALTMTVQWNPSEQGASFDRTLGGPTGAVAWRWLNGDWSPQPGVRTTDNGAYPAIDDLVSTSDGVWTLAGYGALLGVDSPAEAPHQLSLSRPSPNPLRSAAQIRYGLPEGGRVTLALYSLLGERVAILADGPQAPGWHTVPLDASRLPGGVYFLRLDAGGQARSDRVVVLR